MRRKKTNNNVHMPTRPVSKEMKSCKSEEHRRLISKQNSTFNAIFYMLAQGLPELLLVFRHSLF